MNPIRIFGALAVPTLGAWLASPALAGTMPVTASEIECGSMTASVQIDIYDGDFSPRAASVPSGGVVQWTNRGAAPHTVTSGDPGSPSAGMVFDSEEIAPGATYCLQFEGNGAGNYFCEIHPTTMRDAVLRVGEGGPRGDVPGGEVPGGGGPGGGAGGGGGY